MLRTLLAIGAVLGIAHNAYAQSTIPPHLVGVWATDGAVLKGPLLLEGQAIYLGADGVGGVVGGPPPVGFKISATFNTQTNILDLEVIEGTQRHPLGSIHYDPAAKTLDSGAPKHELLRRRYDVLSDSTRRALGL